MNKFIVTQQQLNELNSFLSNRKKVINEGLNVISNKNDDSYKIPKKVLTKIVTETYDVLLKLEEEKRKNQYKEIFQEAKNELLNEGYSKKALKELTFEDIYNKMEESGLVGYAGSDKTFGNNGGVKSFFKKVGKFFGNNIDTLTDIIDQKVNLNLITKSEGNIVFDILKRTVEKNKLSEQQIEELVDSEITDLKNRKSGLNEEKPCWDGYEQIGMKKKNNKRVPNCVPEKK